MSYKKLTWIINVTPFILLIVQPMKLYSATTSPKFGEHNVEYLRTVAHALSSVSEEPFDPTIEVIGKNYTTRDYKPKSSGREMAGVFTTINTVGGVLETSEIVINPRHDRRVRVGRVSEFPFSVHGQLMVHFSGSSYIGTGTLVGPYHVLTAAHNIYNHEYKWPTKVEFTPARDRDTTYFETVQGAKLLTVKGWIEEKEDERDNYDIAMLILDRPVGYKTGWFGLLSTLDHELLARLTFEIRGYPGDKGKKAFRGSEMWESRGSIESSTPTKFYYKIDTSPGQSGSSLSTFHERKYYTLGVHTNGERHERHPSKNRNYGTRISKLIFDLLIKWLKDDYREPIDEASSLPHGSAGAAPRPRSGGRSGASAMPTRVYRHMAGAFGASVGAVAASNTENFRDLSELDDISHKPRKMSRMEAPPSSNPLIRLNLRKLVKTFEALTAPASKVKFLEDTIFPTLSEDEGIEWLDRISNHMQEDNPDSLTIRNLSILTDTNLEHFLRNGMQASFSRLKRLILQGTEITDAILIHIGNIKGLEHLEITDNTGLRKFSGIILGRSMQIPWLIMPNLKHLILNKCVDLAAIELNAPELESLEAQKCPSLVNVQLRTPKLRRLDFSDSTAITDEIIRSIREQCLDLMDIEATGTNAKLYRAYNPIKLQGIGARDFSHLKLGDLGIRQFAKDFRGNSTIADLRLQSNDIGDSGIKALAEALRENTTLRILDLFDNAIGDDGIIALADALQGNNTLEELNIGANPITDMGIEKILEILRTNRKLKKLDYARRLISEKIKEEIDELLKRNQA